RGASPTRAWMPSIPTTRPSCRPHQPTDPLHHVKGHDPSEARRPDRLHSGTPLGCFPRRGAEDPALRVPAHGPRPISVEAAVHETPRRGELNPRDGGYAIPDLRIPTCDGRSNTSSLPRRRRHMGGT